MFATIKVLLATITVSTFVGVIYCEKIDCASSQDTKINVTLYEEIDSESENVTLVGNVRCDRDLFQLFIKGQDLSTLCENFVQLRNELSVLQIIKSNVGEIEPGAFDIASTLTLIRIKDNPLSVLKSGVFNLIKVKELDLSDNQLAEIDAGAFDNNTHLEIVKLNNNHLKELNSDWFHNSPNVYKLDIIYNDIKVIERGAFRNMAENRGLKLRLSANRIVEVDPDALEGHEFVEILRLNGNNLKSLPRELFENYTIYNLQVTLNQLECFPDSLFNSTIKSLAFIDNISFKCQCLQKIRIFSQERQVEVLYPAVICEDKARGVNIVFDYNKTTEIPLIPPDLTI